MKKSIIFIIIGVVLFVGVYIFKYLDSPVETEIARLTEYEEIITGDGYFICDERTYKAGATGTFYTYASEGARVGKSKHIATVYDGVVDSKILQELDNLNKKIDELEEYSKNDIFYVDESNIENRLKNLKNKIIEAKKSNEPYMVSKIKDSIKTTVLKEDSKDIETEVEVLKRQKQTLESQLGYMKYDVVSDCSGVFSTNIDGLEEILTVDRLDEYTIEDFNQVETNRKEETNKVAALKGDTVCKVIDNHTWYIMVKLEREKLDSLKKGQKVALRFDSVPGVEADAKVKDISLADEETEGIAIFECEQYIEGVFSVRDTRVEVILCQHTGYEIPIYAVRNHDGKQGVMVKYSVKEIFKPCEIVFTNTEKGTVIIKAITEGVNNPLEQYDRIVIGEKVKEKEGTN